MSCLGLSIQLSLNLTILSSYESLHSPLDTVVEDKGN